MLPISTGANHIKSVSSSSSAKGWTDAEGWSCSCWKEERLDKSITSFKLDWVTVTFHSSPTEFFVAMTMTKLVFVEVQEDLAVACHVLCPDVLADEFRSRSTKSLTDTTPVCKLRNRGRILLRSVSTAMEWRLRDEIASFVRWANHPPFGQGKNPWKGRPLLAPAHDRTATPGVVRGHLRVAESPTQIRGYVPRRKNTLSTSWYKLTRCHLAETENQDFHSISKF